MTKSFKGVYVTCYFRESDMRKLDDMAQLLGVTRNHMVRICVGAYEPCLHDGETGKFCSRCGLGTT